ncbi:unnamed protein product [Blepharisma stoltei]|uniref:Uncharacterized protein n=1 Tax=Blepharisma stoltei TaxID=1481888 RepID=A0AAU9IP35_9CILI|nr:unnamed protein product [Blepharisma stoltei]
MKSREKLLRKSLKVPQTLSPNLENLSFDNSPQGTINVSMNEEESFLDSKQSTPINNNASTPKFNYSRRTTDFRYWHPPGSRSKESSKPSTPIIPIKCQDCMKASCICGEYRFHRTIKSSSGLTANHFKLELMQSEKSFKCKAPESIMKPALQKTLLYTSYNTMKKTPKNVLYDLRIPNKISIEDAFKDTKPLTMPWKPFLKKSLGLMVNEKSKKNSPSLKEKIVNLGMKYLSSKKYASESTKMVNILYSLIRTGDRYKDISKNRKFAEKINDIAEFLVKHEKALNIERNLFGVSGKDIDEQKMNKLLVFRFHRFALSLSQELIM